MTPKLYKAADVCEAAQLQPYVLRSWEKEFPGIGVQKGADGPRLYRQEDVDQVLRIKQLVFGEGLTLSGARRRLEADGGAPSPRVVMAPAPAAVVDEPAAVSARDDRDSSQPAADGYDELRARLASVREGLQGILDLLSNPQAASADGSGEDYRLEPPIEDEVAPKVRKLTARRDSEKKPAPVAKRKRASA